MKEPRLTPEERELLDKLARRADGEEGSRTRNRPRLNNQLPYPRSDRQLTTGTELSKLKQEFVYRYTTYYNPTRAAIDAGYPPARAHITARNLLQEQEVIDAIAELEMNRRKRLDIDGDQILKQLALIATADLNEVLEVRIPPCRYCYGKNNLYQRTFAEMERALELYNRGYTALSDETVRRRRNGDSLFDEQGGAGYDPDLPPNPDCPECRGRGQEPVVHYKDSRFLSPAGRALLAGVKSTRNGFEVTTHSQLAALSMFARMAARAPPRNVEDMTEDELDAFLEANGVQVDVAFEDAEPLGEGAGGQGDSGAAEEDAA
jgi:phage terminase small subunit